MHFVNDGPGKAREKDLKSGGRASFQNPIVSAAMAVLFGLWNGFVIFYFYKNNLEEET